MPVPLFRDQIVMNSDRAENPCLWGARVNSPSVPYSQCSAPRFNGTSSRAGGGLEVRSGDYEVVSE